MLHAQEIFQRAVGSAALIKKNSHLLEQCPNSERNK